MKRIDNLTGIRAVAAIAVVIYHISFTVDFHGLTTIVKGGWMGVDIFYVLSGLVLSLVYATKLPSKFHWLWYRNFLFRRFAKIYPLHIITFCLTGGLYLAANYLHVQYIQRQSPTVWSAILNLLMLHSLGLTHTLTWNTPSWSVSAEWIAYSVLFAPIVFLLRRVRIIYVAALSTGLWTSLILLAAFILKSPIAALTTDGVLRIIPEFLAGYLLFRLLQEYPWTWGDLATGAGLLLLAAVTLSGNRATWMLLPAVMTLLGGLFTGGRFSDRIFGNRLMIVLGDASYSIYMVQTIVVTAFNQTIRKMHLVEDVPLALLETALVAVAGVLVYRYVEEPSRQYLLRFFKRNLHSSDQASQIQSSLPVQSETTSVM